MKELKELEKYLGYEFKNKKFLENALTHTSYAHEKGKTIKSNERLEFLGDSVLSLAISQRIYSYQPEITEGNMSKIRAAVVCEDSLYEVALRLHYDEFILLGKGEEKLKGNKKPSILADAFEAVLAAIFLDSDFQTAQAFVVRNLEEKMIKEIQSAGEKDHKTKLQELLQGRGVERIIYEIVAENGPDHHKEYEAVVRVKDKVLGRGKGNNKKEAEQNAANEALSNV
ncbi:MAG: ribonuclease III [Clostridia bacterium]|nr:ribonuclease III [Clostridia bacterium]